MTPKRSTGELIAELASSPTPQPFAAARLVSVMLATIALALTFYLLAFGLRPDMATALTQPVVQAKSLLPLAFFATAVWLAVTSSRPGQQVWLWPLAIPVALGIGLVLQRVAATEGSLVAEMAGKSAAACLASISLLSLLPLGAGLLAMRHGAPTRPALSGALLGLASGAGIAAGYALHCMDDSPLFFMLWYSLAIGFSGLVGAYLGNRVLRW